MRIASLFQVNKNEDICINFLRPKKINMCVYGHPSDPMNFYTEFR